MLRCITILLLILCTCEVSLAQSTVVWISIDAFRHDYIDRFHAPYLSKLASEGAFTHQEIPIVPSLTFPNHVAQATGATVDRHGIPLNTFYDPATNQTYDFPDQDSLIRCEPIWITAKRQGVRVAVIDWPMSHAQTGEWKSDYFDQRFDEKKTDQQRLDEVVGILKSDRNSQPLRLVMSYISHVDTIGHRNGPDSPQIRQAVEEADAMLGRFFDSTTDWFNTSHAPQEDLYLLITTDHGMTPIHTLVSMERVIGAELMTGAKLQLGGPIACVYLNELPQAEREKRASQIVAKLKQMNMISAWKSKDMPAKYHFADPTRIGDVVALLPPGYSFTAQRIATTLPATGATIATHGYDPAVCPDMLGGAIVWHYKHPMNGKDLGPVNNTQWHATVAKLLGIKPAEGSDSRAIELP
jgi:hypothetical protein